MAVHHTVDGDVFDGVLFCAILFPPEMSWMRSGTELRQFLGIFLPTQSFNPLIIPVHTDSQLLCKSSQSGSSLVFHHYYLYLLSMLNKNLSNEIYETSLRHMKRPRISDSVYRMTPLNGDFRLKNEHYSRKKTHC